jgi:hypothetical protein
MLSQEAHLENLVRHITLVRDACLLLGKKLIKQGREEFGRILISKGFVHDASKFSGIEWQYLHAGNDVPKDKLALAMQQHCHTNSHHPEYWGSFNEMPEISVYELACDWYARSMEFGTCLRDWIKDTAVKKYNIYTADEPYGWLMLAVDMLLEKPFEDVNIKEIMGV